MGWTGKKSELVEVVYALYHNGCFGDSKIKDIFATFDKILGVKTTDYYHIFSRIRARKFERCAFLYTLRSNFDSVMDKIDRESMR